ncbi:hypothetical protein TNCT_234431 [Trichonephila clavata]|uniref:Uncharacterized protein n=1 Tax=Trichonephila clavata TaxID=2740835 RepID=A0A8X6LWK1_TRICU|nr:hypothetical protein TNCT_234431 [Trichonephila clavata]
MKWLFLTHDFRSLLIGDKEASVRVCDTPHRRFQLLKKNHQVHIAIFGVEKFEDEPLDKPLSSFQPASVG